jgi:hypothetical protein
MVVEKTLNNLREKPHNEKTAVAGGIAVAVVIILLVGWGFFFLRKVQRESVRTLEGTAVPSDQFNLDLIRDTERQLSEMYENSAEELRGLRDNAADNEIPSTVDFSPTPAGTDSSGTDFGTSPGDF